jgi:hypothetical protein
MGRELLAWWLGPARSSGTTPTIDIASTCTVGGRRGLLLIEAKAHDNELERAGKPLKPSPLTMSSTRIARLSLW